MPIITCLAFSFLIASFLSLWIRKEDKIWGSLLGASLFFGLIASNITLVGLLFILPLALLWLRYKKQPTFTLFVLLIIVSAIFKSRALPGFIPYFFTSKFAIGLEGSLIGLFPLALLIPLAKNRKDWKKVLSGTLLGLGGIAFLAIVALSLGAVHLQPHLPSFATPRILSNFFLTSIPEEAFYRGFVQNTLCRYFSSMKGGNLLALLLTSILFTAAHLYWSPNLGVLVLVFLASLLYGGVYLFSGKIESAILCHFLLNLIHMTCFSYHAG